MNKLKEGDKVIVKSKSVAIENGFTYKDFLRNSPLAVGIVVEARRSYFFFTKERFSIDHNTAIFLVKPINEDYFALFAKEDLIALEEEEKRGNE